MTRATRGLWISMPDGDENTILLLCIMQLTSKSRLAAFLYTENHSLGEWFKRSLMAIMMITKTPFAKMKVRSANCTKKAKGGHPDE